MSVSVAAGAFACSFAGVEWFLDDREVEVEKKDGVGPVATASRGNCNDRGEEKAEGWRLATCATPVLARTLDRAANRATIMTNCGGSRGSGLGREVSATAALD